MMTYGDISPRTAAYVVKDLLDRAAPYMHIERFGQTYVMPKNSTQVARFRRYFMRGAPGAGTAAGAIGSVGAANRALAGLVEGVTPVGKKLDKLDISVQLMQIGDWIELTDVIEDTHEDPILKESTDVLGEQAGETLEVLRYNVIKAGTAVRFANGTARNQVNTAISLDMVRRMSRDLLRVNARYITSIVKSTPQYNTQPIEAAFFVLVHPDLAKDIRAVPGFIHPKQYGSAVQLEGEIGTIEDFRFISSTLFEPFPDAGGAAGTGFLSTSGTSADVYPMIALARNAFGLVPLKGANSIVPMVVNPKPVHGDPLGQRGSVGWKTWFAAVILNDAHLLRGEVAATV